MAEGMIRSKCKSAPLRIDSAVISLNFYWRESLRMIEILRRRANFFGARHLIGPRRLSQHFSWTGLEFSEILIVI